MRRIAASAACLLGLAGAMLAPLSAARAAETPAPPAATAPPPPVYVPPAPKPADYAARLDAATKLIDVMHLDRQLDTTLPQVLTLMMNALVRGNTGKEDQIRSILSEEMTAAFAKQRPAIMAVYRDVYATNLTLVEIQGMTAFYSSELGQSVLSKQGKITSDSMLGGAAIGQKATMEALPHIVQRMQAAKMAVPQGI